MNCQIENNQQHFKSLERFNSYPIVSDSYTSFLGYYRWIKSANKTIESTLSSAENALETIRNRTEPFAAEKLQFVDNLCVNQLERLERLCPIVKEPSENIYQIPGNIYEHQVKPRVNSIIIEPITKVGLYTLNTVENTVDHLMPAIIIEKTEYIMDKYVLTKEEGTEAEDKNLSSSKRIKRMTNRGRKQLYKKAIKELEILYEVSVHKLEKMRELIKDVHKITEDSKQKLQVHYENSMSVVKSSDFNPLHYIQNVEEQSSRLIKQSQSILRYWTETAQTTRDGLMENVSYNLAKNLVDPLISKMIKLQNSLNENSNDKQSNGDTTSYIINRTIHQTGLILNLLINVTITLKGVLNNFHKKDQELEEIKESSSDSVSSNDNEYRAI